LNNILPQMRRKMKIKQRELAGVLEVSPSYLCKVEKGLIDPTDTFRKSCADYFNEDMEILFFDGPKNRNEIYPDEQSVNNVWSARKRKNIKQNKLAELLGCSPSYLSKIEKGLQAPNEKFKKKCAKALKIKETELFPEK